MSEKMNKITEELLSQISDYDGEFHGAYNIRQDGKCAGRVSSKNIKIESKTDSPGLDIWIAPGTRGETVFIPACVTMAAFDDLVYNDFHVGEGADVIVQAGCGVHTDSAGGSSHNGIHRFFVGTGARVKYLEKHIGTGRGTGRRKINPVTDAILEKDSYLEMDTSQIGGVQLTNRRTTAKLAEGSHLVVHERLFTDKDQRAETFFRVDLNGAGSAADIISRSVARDRSYQSYTSTIAGNAPCTGHSECDAIIDGDAIVDASPRLLAHNKEASLIHEAAIGRIAGEQIMKLRTLGLTEEEAERMIIEGFLE